jgi:hypothetical protein
MAKNKKKEDPMYNYLEQWDTRYGLSDRIVIRKNGKFVNNISLTALRKGTPVTSR